MSIFEQIKELLKDRKDCIITATEVKEKLKTKYGTNPTSVILSDLCYNRVNDGILFDKHLFKYVDRNRYIYLGENYPYTGKIYHKPAGSKEEKVVGEWINGTKKHHK